jgi:endonuclease G
MFRIIWQFNRDRFEAGDLFSGAFSANEALGLGENFQVVPVFLDPKMTVEAESLEASDDPEDDLAHYFQAITESEEEAQLVLRSLTSGRKLGLIRWFDLQTDIGSRRAINEDDPDDLLEHDFDPGPDGPSQAWDRYQLYLDRPDSTPGIGSPVGVDARYLWSIRGGRGEGIRLVDIEKGWNLDHEDLTGQVCCRFGESDPDAHGTAVLGILCAAPLDAQNQPLGVIGIAHGAAVGVAPFQAEGSFDLNPEGVIRRVLRWLSPGDVLVLEVNASRPGLKVTPNTEPLLPVEAWAHGRAAIRLANSKGVYVVEAAGNGGFSLNLREHDVQKTGPALMVGAGHFRTGRALFFSNRGPRVDLQGWGHNVVTSGAAIDEYRDLQLRNNTNQCYTAQFSGTSSATAIVAGCVAVISGVVKAHGFDPLTPSEMKELLHKTGSFRSRDQNGGIGPLPNLRSALKALEERFRREDRDFPGFASLQKAASLRRQDAGRSGGFWEPSTTSSTGYKDRRRVMIKYDRFSPEQVDKAYEKALKTYGHRDNVTAVDVGYKYEGGERTEETAVRIHVKEKLDESVLEAAEIFPPTIEGVPVDVIQAVYRPQAELSGTAVRTQRMDPIQPGISCGHRSITAGTLGAMVFDRVSGKKAILSNWHILAGSSTAQAGDAILQPGRADGGKYPGDNVASLERWILNAHGDAAVALLNDSRTAVDEPLGSGAPLQAPRMVKQGEIVQKSGRTTGVTDGRVDGTGRYFIDYDGRMVGIDGFKIVSVKDGNPDDEEISSGGDSGSLWYVEGSKEAVGLHFAGETDPQPDQEHALACHLPRVLDALNVSLGPVDKKQVVVAKRQTPKSNSSDQDLLTFVQKNRDPLMELLRLLMNGKSTPALEVRSEARYGEGSPH